MSLLTLLRVPSVAPNPCVVAPVGITVSQWPTRGMGSQRCRYTLTGPALVATVLWGYNGTVETVTVTDTRGCQTTVTRP